MFIVDRLRCILTTTNSEVCECLLIATVIITQFAHIYIIYIYIFVIWLCVLEEMQRRKASSGRGKKKSLRRINIRYIYSIYLRCMRASMSAVREFFSQSNLVYIAFHLIIGAHLLLRQSFKSQIYIPDPYIYYYTININIYASNLLFFLSLYLFLCSSRWTCVFFLSQN